MAQLKLSLPQQDIDTIRRVAAERRMTVSAFLRDSALGVQEVELPPQSMERLTMLESYVSDIARDLTLAVDQLRGRVTGLEGAVDLEPIERRLSYIEERAGL